MPEVKNKVCLMYVPDLQERDAIKLTNHSRVHDGWGISDLEEGNAVKGGTTKNMDDIAANHSHRSLAAHGIAVGLSDGLMGNSEVG
jgi:2,3-bisphosphoglycerate-independent phosphoglycerate mutase